MTECATMRHSAKQCATTHTEEHQGCVPTRIEGTKRPQIWGPYGLLPGLLGYCFETGPAILRSEAGASCSA